MKLLKQLLNSYNDNLFEELLGENAKTLQAKYNPGTNSYSIGTIDWKSVGIQTLGQHGFNLAEPTSWADLEKGGRYTDRNVTKQDIKHIFSRFGTLHCVDAQKLWPYGEPLTPTEPPRKYPHAGDTDYVAAFIVKFSPSRMYLVDTSNANVKIKKWAKII